VAVALLALLVLLLAPPGGQVSLDQRLSTLRTSPDGAAALYETLDLLGIPVDRRMTPLDGPGSLGGALAILDPTQPVADAELDAVVDWVEGGGTLIAAAPLTGLPARLGVRSELVGLEEDRLPSPVPHPWTAGVDSVGPVTVHMQVEEDSPLRAVQPLLTLDGSERLVALRARLGAGAVVLFSDPALLGNGRITATGGGLIFARAARWATAAGQPLVFDEYHHGHRGSTPTDAFFGFLARTPVGWLMLQMAAVALLATLPAALRFGAPVASPPASRRSPLEHVAALGEVYRQTRAADLARRRLLTGFARRLGRERPPAGGEASFLERIARGVPAGREAVDAVAGAWEARAPVRTLAQRIDDALKRLNRMG
jgi:Domain of unknown function (DUF4350)